MQTETEILKNAVESVMAFMREHVRVQKIRILRVEKEIEKLDKNLEEIYRPKSETQAANALETISKIEQCIENGLTTWNGFVEKEDADEMIPARILVIIDETCKILDEPIYFADSGFTTKKPSKEEYILIREKHS